MMVDLTSERAQRLAALGEPVRLRVLDALATGDRSPGDLAADLGVAGNLLAHHLKVLERAGLLRRRSSEADRRRAYLQLRPEALDGLLPGRHAISAGRVVFVCTHNSARSQLAAAVWRTRSDVPVASGGTSPARRVHPQAVRVARLHGLRLDRARPQAVDDVLEAGDYVVSVCDAAHEALDGEGRRHVHWSVPDPVRAGTVDAFEQAYDVVASRVVRLAEHLTTSGAER